MLNILLDYYGNISLTSCLNKALLNVTKEHEEITCSGNLQREVKHERLIISSDWYLVPCTK